MHLTLIPIESTVIRAIEGPSIESLKKSDTMCSSSSPFH